jgi:hypothetical protein
MPIGLSGVRAGGHRRQALRQKIAPSFGKIVSLFFQTVARNGGISEKSAAFPYG